MKLKTTFIAVALLLSVTSTQAALVETDWNNTGDGLATLDTDTGIEWLDLTQTYNMSINQVEGMTVAGGVFDGWKLPTRAEVTQMLTSTFAGVAANIGTLNYVYDSIGGAADVNAAATFQSLFGTTGDARYSYALHKNELSGENVLVSGVNGARPTVYSNYQKSDDYNYAQNFHSVYLISDGGTTLSSILDPSLNINNPSAPINAVSDVSTPALLGLMGLGLLGFSVRRRSSDTSETRK